MRWGWPMPFKSLIHRSPVPILVRFPISNIQTAPILIGTHSNTEIRDQSGNGFDGYVMGVTDTDACPDEDLDGDGVPAWEDCDDNDSTIFTGTGSAQNCPATSCKTILEDGFSTGDGIYWVDPDGLGVIEVYCDMSNDGGGWTMLVQGGANCQSHSCSNHTMTSLNSIQPSDSCSYLDDITVSRLASVGTDVILRSGNAFGNWSTSAMSTNSLAVEALQVPGANWHNGATWDNWDWSHPNTPACATGWPNMFHADGNAGGVHWIVGDGISNTWNPSPSTISTGWVR